MVPVPVPGQKSNMDAPVVIAWLALLADTATVLRHSLCVKATQQHVDRKSVILSTELPVGMFLVI